jgi:acetate---CoA ligase (ADP-forming)
VQVAWAASWSAKLRLALRHAPSFGPFVLVGARSKSLDAVPDVRVLFPPFSAVEVMTAFDQLGLAPPRGRPGRPEFDLESVAAVAVQLGTIAHQVVSIDINRLIAAEGGCTASDAVVVV